MPALSRYDALAFNDDYAEFQQDRVIIRVDFPFHGEPEAWLGRASAAFDAIWPDLGRIVAFARAHLRRLQPARWQRYDAAAVSEHALIVYGIWIDPADGGCSVHVSFDPFLRLPAGLQALTEEDEVMVARAASGWLAIEGTPPPDALLIAFPLTEGTLSRLPLRCPCCRCRTLRRRGIHSICPVCFWEDDGQDDDDADIVVGGPNGRLSLTQGRANYAEFGASQRKDLPHVRPPRADELPQDGPATRPA